METPDVNKFSKICIKKHMRSIEAVYVYSQLHKYLDKVIVILAVHLSVLEFKLNDEYEQKVQTFCFNLNVYLKVLHISDVDISEVAGKVSF